MRTTLKLDADVVRLIQDAVHRERRSSKQVINDALRRALRPEASAPTARYRLTPHDSAVQPGLDLGAFNRLADELADEAHLRSTRTAS